MDSESIVTIARGRAVTVVTAGDHDDRMVLCSLRENRKSPRDLFIGGGDNNPADFMSLCRSAAAAWNSAAEQHNLRVREVLEARGYYIPRPLIERECSVLSDHDEAVLESRLTTAQKVARAVELAGLSYQTTPEERNAERQRLYDMERARVALEMVEELSAERAALRADHPWMSSMFLREPTGFYTALTCPLPLRVSVVRECWIDIELRT